MKNESSFLLLDDALVELFENPQRALYFYEFELFYGSSYNFDYCDTLILWESENTVHYSMAAKKNLPEFKSINWLIDAGPFISSHFGKVALLSQN